ncbi:hypothetical protein E6C67_03065 (plasmid) [Azospirillum sp. TSA2s]|uniref:hypothetical protein n=1 Tax=Azospirillum sp. TSA2s TaxID=709810 RepID=UPI0010A9F2BC|nr:hypothetical protein [Azospirillum sp. TSA2s]QCG92945.1 hypothetical protein E6C67_03065 [Azospirillum sp. TSA2s]
MTLIGKIIKAWLGKDPPPTAEGPTHQVLAIPEITGAAGPCDSAEQTHRRGDSPRSLLNDSTKNDNEIARHDSYPHPIPAGSIELNAPSGSGSDADIPTSTPNPSQIFSGIQAGTQLPATDPHPAPTRRDNFLLEPASSTIQVKEESEFPTLFNAQHGDTEGILSHSQIVKRRDRDSAWRSQLAKFQKAHIERKLWDSRLLARRYNPMSLIDYFFSDYSKRNEYKIVELNLNNKRCGLFLMHSDLIELANTGSIEDYLNSPEKEASRSYLILTEEYLLSLRSSNYPNVALYPAFDSREIPLSEFHEDRPDLPLIRGGDRTLRQLYAESAVHFLAHGKVAECIWSFSADLINAGSGTFQRIDRLKVDNSETDGGVDDLRKTPYGHLVTQVKGATTYQRSIDPYDVASKLFVTSRKGQTSEKAKLRRIRLYPDLGVRRNGALADDFAAAHLLMLGRRTSGKIRLVSGRSETTLIAEHGTTRRLTLTPPIERYLFVTGLDIIVLKPLMDGQSNIRPGVHVDASAASKKTADALRSSGVVAYDEKVPLHLR